jgi:formylglycine-generating enzyme required for sulfatase activity
MGRWRSLHCLVLSGCFVLFGCSPKDRNEAECQVDGDCPELQACQDGSCEQVQCKRDGDCPSGERCMEYECVVTAPCRTDADCEEPTPLCNLDTGQCVSCLPRCTGKCCGDDGCGGDCPDLCAATGQNCNSETCECEGVCVPDCAGRVCGPDKCGETCPPGCDGEEFCDDGICKLPGCDSDQDCQAPLRYCQLATRACVECLENEHCAGEQICSGGACSDQPTCQTDSQCEYGEICVGGDCVSGCRSNRDCPDDEYCVEEMGDNGTCVECELPEDCPEGTTCEGYQCVTWCTEEAHCTPRYCNLDSHDCVDCLEDSHCGADTGMICEGLVCVEGCRIDEDCPGGTCDQVTHQCIECETKDDCTLGFLCIDQQCVVGCEDSRDCPGDLVCDGAMGDNGTCVQCIQDIDCNDEAYVCQDGLCVFFCGSDQDCEPPQPACDLGNGVCVACTDNVYCDEGTICVDHACLPGCQNDGDCPGGMVCDPELGTHGGCVDCKVNEDCPNGYICENANCVLEGSEMIRIPGGTFVMGSDSGEGDTNEEPERVVSLPTYYIDKTPVTNEQYRACVQAGACTEPAEMTAYNDPNKANHPVVYVTWEQAGSFCYWMDKGRPSEARWERAARGPAPDERTYPWGEGSPSCTRANYSGCQGDTTPVGSHPQGASTEGALDMAGNVYEWVYDIYASDYYGQADNTDDPYGPAEGDYRVIRGGGFDSLSEYLRCANRGYRSATEAAADVGFRCSMRGSPSASFVVNPEEGPYETTHFSVDASSTTDLNHPLDSLEVHWDWEDDGNYDTSWTTAKADSHRYAYPGIFRIRMEVRDPDGNVSDTSNQVLAAGDEGWDGAVCESHQDCAHGFVCIAQGIYPIEYFCRESCIWLLTTCHFEGQTCEIVFDVNSELNMACRPGG